MWSSYPSTCVFLHKYYNVHATELCYKKRCNAHLRLGFVMGVPIEIHIYSLIVFIIHA